MIDAAAATEACSGVGVTMVLKQKPRSRDLKEMDKSATVLRSHDCYDEGVERWMMVTIFGSRQLLFVKAPCVGDAVVGGLEKNMEAECRDKNDVDVRKGESRDDGIDWVLVDC